MNSYRCIVCGESTAVLSVGRLCINENCELYNIPLPESATKALDQKRRELQGEIDYRRWRSDLLGKVVDERDEARQVARRMKVERDNARAQYELLKKVLGPEV